LSHFLTPWGRPKVLKWEWDRGFGWGTLWGMGCLWVWV